MDNSSHLRTSILINAPYVNACFFHNRTKLSEELSSKCEYPGLVAEIIRFLFKSAEIDLEFVANAEIKQNDFQSLLDSIKNGHEDVLLTEATALNSRKSYALFSEDIYAMTNQVQAVYTHNPVPSLSRDALRFLSPYDIRIWLFIAFIFGSIKICGKLDKMRTANVTFYFLAFFLSILAGLYQGYLLSQLLVRPVNPLFKDSDHLAKLVENGHVKVVLFRGAYFHLSNENLRAALKSKEPVFMDEFGDEDAAFAKLSVDDSYVLLTSSHVFTLYLVRKWCQFTVTSMDDEARNAIIFSKNVSQSVLDRVNKAIQTHQSSLMGIKERYIGIMRPQKTNCTDKNSLHQKGGLNIREMLGIFLLLIVGGMAGLVTVTGEITTRKGLWTKLKMSESSLLRTPSYVNIPYVYPCFINNRTKLSEPVPSICEYPGLMAEMFSFLFKSADIDLEFVEDHQITVASFQSELDTIKNGHADVLLSAVAAIESRKTYASFANKIYAMTSQVYAVYSHQQVPSLSQDALRFLSPYDYRIWMFIAFIFGAIKIYGKFDKMRTANVMFYFLAFFLSILAGLYQGYLLSQLLVRLTNPLFKDPDQLAELVKNGRVKVVFFRGTYFDFSNANLQAALEAQGPLYLDEFGDLEAGFAKLNSDNRYVLLSIGHVYTLHLTRKWCHLTLTQMEDKSHNTIMFNKNVSRSVLDRVNKAIAKHQTSLMAIKERYVHSLRRPQPFNYCTTNEMLLKKEALSIRELLGIFCLLVVGGMAGLVTIAGEKLYVIVSK